MTTHAINIEKFCNVCGIGLTNENWHLSSQKSQYNICKKCKNKKQQERRLTRDKDKRNKSDKEFRQNNPEYAERQRENTRQWRKKNPIKLREGQLSYIERRKIDPILRKKDYISKRIKILKEKYNLTLEDFDKLISSQNAKCVICKREFISTPDIDHCHKTGKVRGLLCRACNTLVGQVEKRWDLIKIIREYLEAFKYETS